MVTFGNSFILLEIYNEKFESKMNHSTKTSAVKKYDNILDKYSFSRAGTYSAKTRVKKTVLTTGDKPLTPCISLALYNKEVYIKKL